MHRFQDSCRGTCVVLPTGAPTLCTCADLCMEWFLQSITRLEINTALCRSSVEDGSKLLCLLAPACPTLQELKVLVDISRCRVTAFGDSCSNPSRLDVTGQTTVSENAWGQLHHQLPHLTHCHISSLVSSMSVSPCYLPLLSRSSLKILDLGRSFLTPEMWPLLPPGLTQLQCSLGGHPPTELHTLSNLRSLTLHS